MNESSPLLKGFAYLHELFPRMLWNARYAGCQNFIGGPVDGYLSPAIVMSLPLAEALGRAQGIFETHGYQVVVYDAYRPQKAVDHFLRWSQDEREDALCCENYHPSMPKGTLFQRGYIARKSSHTRGCAIDLTLIGKGKMLKPLEVLTRSKTNGQVYSYLDDGTCDMGTHFDFLDDASHTESNLVSEGCLQLRQYFKDVMTQCGFKNYSKEWWHFQLVDEPYQDMYFDFDIR